MYRLLICIVAVLLMSVNALAAPVTMTGNDGFGAS
jgi:hypothetical protein